MAFQTFRAWWARHLSDTSRSTAGVLHEAAAFRSLLEVERMRSDRSGTTFALVVLGGPQDGLSQREQFASRLRLCVRATDHVGWVDSERIGVILWDTAAEGAWNFLEKLARSVASVAPQDCDIFVYPAEQDSPPGPTRDSQHRGREAASGHPLTQPARAERATDTVDLAEALYESSVDATLCETQKLLDLLDEPAETSGELSLAAQPLEKLFVKPMPVWKRTIDILGATAGLLLLSPVLLATAVAVKLTSPGPVFFAQWRSGRGGRRFRMYKFRSMVADAEKKKQELMELNEQDGPAFKIENDPRITPVGRFIRRTSIDELPQLWNVLKGEMSLVGPRPLPCHETDACSTWQRRRLDVTPGLTCIWQVQDQRTKIPFGDWARMDIRYIGKRSLKQDLKLILLTVRSMLGRKGT